MEISTNDSRQRWEVRFRRAQELGGKHPAIANALRFYETTLAFQADVAVKPVNPINPDAPLRERIDLTAVSSMMPAILSLSAERGPDQLRFEAEKVLHAGEERWRQLLKVSLVPGRVVPVASDDFFARACLQPVAENLQVQLPKDPNYTLNVCPACGSLPQLAVVRPAAEGARRSLLCSLCLCEWSFPKIMCPWCGEEDKQKLPNYRSESWAYIHVEACDNCQRYFKVVDTTIEASAVPLVDEAALAVLDVWASGLGYVKIIRNLIGF